MSGWLARQTGGGWEDGWVDRWMVEVVDWWVGGWIEERM